jgi:hypothetical protein
MGWLPVRRKHKSDEYPEQAAVPAVGDPSVTGGTGGVGTVNQSVVPPPGSYNVKTSPVPAGSRGSFIVGPQYPHLKPSVCPVDVTGYCGHKVAVVLVAGCEHGHVVSWLTCHDCQMETLRQIRHNPERCYLGECGGTCLDLIYSYLPGDPKYHNLKGRIFEAGGLEA